MMKKRKHQSTCMYPLSQGPMLLMAILLSMAGQSQIILPYDSLRINPMIAMTAKPVVGTFDLLHIKSIPYPNPDFSPGGLLLEKQLNYHDASDNLVNEGVQSEWIANAAGVTEGGYIYPGFGVVATMADLNGDNTDELVYAVEGEFNAIQLIVYQFDPVTGALIPSPGSTFCGYTHDLIYAFINVNLLGTVRVRLERIDVDYDGTDEVGIAYYSSTSSAVHVEIWKGALIDGTLSVTNTGTLVVPYAFQPDDTHDKWDVDYGDFNLDGRPEMVFADASDVTLYELQYNSAAGTSVEFIEKASIPLNFGVSWGPNYIGVPTLAVGDFNGDLIPEIFAVTWENLGESIIMRNLFQVGDDPTTAAVDYLEKLAFAYTPEFDLNWQSTDFIGYGVNVAYLDVESADIDNNGRDELLVYHRSNQYWDGIGYLNNEMFTTVLACNTPSLADWQETDYLDLNGNVIPNVPLQRLSAGSSATNDLKIPVDVSLSGYSGLNSTFGSFWTQGIDNSIRSMCYGDIQGDAYTVKNQRKTSMSNISQPIFILSAPPVHSDDINGVFTDLACSGDNCEGFSTTLFLETTQNISVSNTIHSDWSMGAYAGVGFDLPFGLGSVSAKLGATYGESYENIQASSQTVTITEERTADGDDSYLVSKVDYVVYEYDVFKGNEFATKLISVHPKLINNEPVMTWINGKNLDGLVETHEIGNILSYRRPNDTPLSGNEILISLNNYDVTSGSSSVTFDQAEQQGLDQSTSWDQGLSASADFQVGAVEAGIEGAYNWGGLSTHGVSYETSTSVQVNFGSINTSYTAPYFIKPLISLNNGGGISVQYEAEPILPTLGASNVWNTPGSELDYTNHDLSWSLPWRLDIQRGVQDVIPTNTRKCRSIWVTKPLDNNVGYDASATDPNFTIKEPLLRNPMPGSTVNIHARVFNYSTEISEQSLVSFYLGHPELDGLMLSDVNGVTSVVVPPIQPQNYRDVVFTVTLPTDDTNGRLYGVIDPENTMEEFHENNNLGWAPMGYYYAYPDEIFSSVAELPNNPEKLRVYPNPASNSALIMIELGNNTQQATLNIVDLSGRVVHSEKVFSNSQRNLDLRSIDNGIYVIEVLCENKIHTTKLIVNH